VQEELKQYRALRELTSTWATFPGREMDSVFNAIMMAGNIEDMDALLTHFAALKGALSAANEARYKLLSAALKQAEQRHQLAKP